MYKMSQIVTQNLRYFFIFFEKIVDFIKAICYTTHVKYFGFTKRYNEIRRKHEA